VEGLSDGEFANCAVADTATARVRAIHKRNTVNFIAVHARAEAGVKEAILVVIAGAEVGG